MEALSGLVLFLMTSCTGAVTVDICNDKNATFRWDDYEVTPFHAVEWYVNRTLMADIFEDRLSQKSLRINADYKSRFVLLEEDKIGFNLTNVTKNDEGNYACILTLKGTGTLQEVNETLNVKDCTTTTTSSASGEGTTTPTLPTEDSVNVAPIVVGVIMGVVLPLAAIVIGVVLYRRRKRRPEDHATNTEAMEAMTV